MLVIFIATIAAYAIATFFRVKEKVAGRSFKYHADFSFFLGLVGNAIMTVKMLALSDVDLHYDSFFISGALGLGISTLAIEKGLKESYFSIFTIPAMVCFLLCATFVDGKMTGEYFSQKWFTLHLLLSILGESFFFISAISSLTYFFVVRRLKRKNRLRAVFFFPPLTRLDDLTFKLIASGTAFFAAGLAIGFYGNFTNNHELTLGSKHIFSLLVLFFYLTIVVSRKPLKIAGTRLATLAMLGFFLSLGMITIPDNASHWKPIKSGELVEQK